MAKSYPQIAQHTRYWVSALAVFFLTWQPAFGAERTESKSLTSERISVLESRFRQIGVERQAHHLAQLKVDRWQAEGFLGQGVKVAILDSGFRGYWKFLGGTLPAKITVHSFRKDGNLEARNSQHGILCGEVIHAVAPKAELLFANWEQDDSAQFVKAVQWAREQGARVISCSVIMPNWSDGEGGGSVHGALSRLIGTGESFGDPLCFASAGNTAQRHWSGVYHGNGTGNHEWGVGKIDNEITPWGREDVSIELYGPHASDSYELSVYESETARLVGSAMTQGRDSHLTARVRFTPEKNQSYSVRVRLVEGKGGRFHLVALGGNLSVALAEASVSFPADGAEFVAVGAVDELGSRQWYSSCGSKTACPKPDFVAPVPFPSLSRTKTFGGTSAAAPQAAGLAALCLSRHSDWKANQLRKFLQSSARDVGTPGFDFETGYGWLNLP